MMNDREFRSPAEVSRALGISVTTVKRWVDAGVLPAHKTAGGHRKILLADVLRIVRKRNFPALDLSLLNLVGSADESNTSRLSQRLFDALREGDIAWTRSVIHGAHAAGVTMDQLGDAVVAPAMERLGHEWENGRIDVMHEHRSTLLCTAVLHELKPALESTAARDRPVAAGGSPESDHSLLASLLVQMVLLDGGWEAINLGPHTPLTSFRLAIRELKPRLIWLSASYLPETRQFLDEYRMLYDEASAAGVAVAIGGRAIRGSLQATMPAAFHGNCLADLSTFAQSLHPPLCPPRRGRPPK
jgi:excisionase family DNA binding protein